MRRSRKRSKDSIEIQEKKIATYAQTKEKFVFLAVITASVICSVGFTVWKHYYQKWNLQEEARSAEEYENVLKDYTIRTKDLIFDLKTLTTKALKLREDDFDDRITQEAEHLMEIEGMEEVHVAESAADEAGSFTQSSEALKRKEEFDYASQAFSLTKKTIKETVALSAMEKVGETLVDVGFQTSAAAMGGTFLLISIIKNVMALRTLSSQLKRAKLNRKFSASNAHSEGQKVEQHARWAVCKVVSDLYGFFEQTPQPASDEQEEVNINRDLLQTSIDFKSELKEFWNEKRCSEFVSHEFVKGNSIGFEDGDGIIEGTILKIRSDSTYEVEVSGTKHQVLQHNIKNPTQAGVVPPIRGNGLVVNMGISTDCYESDRAYDAEHPRSRDGRHYRDWKMLGTKRFDSGARVYELNKNPKDMNAEKIASARADCANSDKKCIDKREESIKNVRDAFSRYDCESSFPKSWNGKDKSRVIVYKQLEPTMNSNRALYKLDLHQMYVGKHGDWRSVMSLGLLGMPGWLRSETDPIRSSMVPNWMRHLYRSTKESVQSNPNIDAVALSRGIDFETAHFLAPRWSLTDVSEDSQRHRCGLLHNALPSNFDLRWLSACKGLSPDFMDNEFRDQFTDAMQRGREVEKTNGEKNNGYTPILDNMNDVSNEEVVIFWNKGENAPTFLGRSMSDVPGPCVLRGVVNPGTYGGDIQVCKCSDRKHSSHECPAPHKTICYVSVSIIGVPTHCGTETSKQNIDDDAVPIDIQVERRKIYRYVEAAQISKRLIPYCFKPFSEFESRTCRTRSKLRNTLFGNIHYTLRDENNVFRAAVNSVDQSTSLITLNVDLQRKCDERWETSAASDECISEAILQETANDDGETKSSSSLSEHCEQEKKAWELECKKKKKKKKDGTGQVKVMTPVEMYVATLMSDPQIARGTGIDIDGRSNNVDGKCVMKYKPALNSETYLDCVARLLNSPNNVVDDAPGWNRDENSKLMARHEILPDLRFFDSGSDASLFAFFARKTDKLTSEQPAIRDLRLTLSSNDMPDIPEMCPGDEKFITPIVRDDHRHKCNWWRVSSSLGEGTTSAIRHNMYVWVKRRFAIDPCDVSPDLGGWKNEQDKSAYCTSTQV